MATSLCDQCAALCCRYFAFPIDNPTTAREFDNIRWYLCHENVVIFIDDGQWYMGIMNRCKHLQNDNKCGIYETRPKICRSYTTDKCDYHGGEYDFDKLFTSAEELRVFGEQHLKELRAEKRKKAKRKKEKRRADRLVKRAGAGRAVVQAHPGKVRRSNSTKDGKARRRLSAEAFATESGYNGDARKNGNGLPVRIGNRLALPVLRNQG